MSIVGAPYTGLMTPSKTNMIDLMKEFREFGVARINVYSNFLGKAYPRQGKLIRSAISSQFNSPIKWEQIMQTLYRKHQVSLFWNIPGPNFHRFVYEKRRSRKPGKLICLFYVASITKFC